MKLVDVKRTSELREKAQRDENSVELRMREIFTIELIYERCIRDVNLLALEQIVVVFLLSLVVIVVVVAKTRERELIVIVVVARILRRS